MHVKRAAGGIRLQQSAYFTTKLGIIAATHLEHCSAFALWQFAELIEYAADAAPALGIHLGFRRNRGEPQTLHEESASTPPVAIRGSHGESLYIGDLLNG